ncbi:hypothetical protein BS47DRAFT_1360497 [Hydnum rufescens UP504]|uniref:Uncharacterized protein n=1 Tax=Hydnum rufescens UP504 TaxID=1448309 RepID=A0A9P6B223_9AGAM|nr:hypothetical protein BS47DRAFT_1360497 [Hydnum rufescens UP504]
MPTTSPTATMFLVPTTSPTAVTLLTSSTSPIVTVSPVPSTSTTSSASANRDKTNWPNWLDAQVDQLQNAEFGPQWGALIDMWLELEKTLRFPSEMINDIPYVKGKALSNQDHPKSIADWIQHVWSPKFKPSINPKVFRVQWWKWWSRLQPAWRKKSPDGIVLASQM